MSQFTYGQAKVDKLNARIAELEAEVADLKQKLSPPVEAPTLARPQNVASGADLPRDGGESTVSTKKKDEPEVLHQRKHSR